MSAGVRPLNDEITIREFVEPDAAAVLDLFTLVNRQLATPATREAFEAYIARSVTDEIGRIADYYAERDGGFWVASHEATIVGTFGLERTAPDAMELRRMYVHPAWRRRGIARMMLRFAETQAHSAGSRRLELSTSELQPAAVELYRRAGYRLLREETADQLSHKTVGGGIRRYYFEKAL